MLVSYDYEKPLYQSQEKLKFNGFKNIKWCKHFHNKNLNTSKTLLNIVNWNFLQTQEMIQNNSEIIK